MVCPRSQGVEDIADFRATGVFLQRKALRFWSRHMTCVSVSATPIAVDASEAVIGNE
jgi:hypothetical protein